MQKFTYKGDERPCAKAVTTVESRFASAPSVTSRSSPNSPPYSVLLSILKPHLQHVSETLTPRPREICASDFSAIVVDILCDAQYDL